MSHSSDFPTQIGSQHSSMTGRFCFPSMASKAANFLAGSLGGDRTVSVNLPSCSDAGWKTDSREICDSEPRIESMVGEGNQRVRDCG